VAISTKNIFIFFAVFVLLACAGAAAWFYAPHSAPSSKKPAGVMHSLDVCAGMRIPKLESRVTDLAHIYMPDEKLDLETYLGTFEENSGSQIVVLTIRTLGSKNMGKKDIATFGTCTLNNWKLGRRNIDDGALITIAVDDKKVRIDVGCGLESILPNSKLQTIVNDIMLPAFKKYEYHLGTVKTIEALVRPIERAGLPPPNTPAPKIKTYVAPPTSAGCIA
jgi:uncharacterized protein